MKIRAVLATAIIFAGLFTWFAVRWQIGNLLATITQASDPNISAIADIAVGWAPADPAAHSLKSGAGEDSSMTIKALEDTVRLAPYDYRWRTALGRAYEQDGMIERAESELQGAVNLAPANSSAHWYLGNFYLRQERRDAAVEELRMAAENNPRYRDQVFSLVWDYSNKDALQLESLVGEHPELLARLSYFFAARGRAEESLRSWNRLSAADKASNVTLARAIALGLYDQRHFSQSLEFLRQFGAEEFAKPEAVTNGSFENDLEQNEDSRFGWLIARNDPKFEAIIDPRIKHAGRSSLRVTFKSFSKPGLANVFQTVVVNPSKKYRLNFWIKTENLKSVGGPMLEILNANDDRSIIRSQIFPTGNNDWQSVSLDFIAPINCNGISIRTIRAACGDDCPITGNFWFDDFELAER